jgi:uncharacterized protein YjbI with pentapeptide repeats
MNAQTIENTDNNSTESYQLIKDEHLNNLVITSQVLSGSRILLSTYKGVVFSESSFYACEFQGVTFENCVFEDCNFDFSHFRKCSFVNCSFVGCNKKATSSLNCFYSNCVFEPESSSWVDETCNTVLNTKNDHTTDIYISLSMAA